jgi:hypothetical protein
MVKLLSWRLAPVLLLATTPFGPAPRHAPEPFAVGEQAEYDVKYGFIHAGTGSLSVVSIDTVRQRDAYRFRLTMTAGVNLRLYKYTLRDTMESWVDTATFQSLRFIQNQMDHGRARRKHYEIFPEREAYSDGGKPEQVSVADPLDDIAFLYFVRTQPLDVGTTQEFARHFKPSNNPLILKVLGRDTIEAAGRKWSTVVVQPVIKTSTMFADGEAKVWISDDPSHVIVQINAKVSIGSITMKLKSYRAAPGLDSTAVGAPARR